MSKTVVLGPYSWNSSTPLGPGEQYNWALAILSALPGGNQQDLQGLTVTAVPTLGFGGTIVQALGVTATTVVSEPSGQITVNFTVTNKHATANCFGYRWWVAMVVP